MESGLPLALQWGWRITRAVHPDELHGDVTASDAALRELRAAARPFPDVPVVVLSAARSFPLPRRFRARWTRLQAGLAAAASQGRHVVVDGTGHNIPRDRLRLTGHYSPDVNRWLDSVPRAIDAAATAWNLTVTGYHDAGCASVIALACDDEHTPYVIKAWYDPGRYRREIAALRRWAPRLTPEVTHAADHLAVAAMRLVADSPGGAAAPADEYDAVAHGLRRLHSRAMAPTAFPSLASYIEGEVLPRIHRRAVAVGGRVPESCLLRGRPARPSRQAPGRNRVAARGHPANAGGPAVGPCLAGSKAGGDPRPRAIGGHLAAAARAGSGRRNCFPRPLRNTDGPCRC